MLLLVIAACVFLVAVLGWVFRSRLDDATNPGQNDFIPSTTFKGEKDGYVFTTRDGKTGYYRDDPPDDMQELSG